MAKKKSIFTPMAEEFLKEENPHKVDDLYNEVRMVEKMKAKEARRSPVILFEDMLKRHKEKINKDKQ